MYINKIIYAYTCTCLSMGPSLATKLLDEGSSEHYSVVKQERAANIFWTK